MNSFVTLSDINFLDKGLVLYDSISKYTKDFRLYYLCLDTDTFNKVLDLEFDNLIPYHINNLIEEDSYQKLSLNASELDKVSNIPQIQNGDSTNLHYALTPYIIEHLINKYNLPELIYIDADIKFYSDANILYEVADESVGLVLHRHNRMGCKAGAYNVGVIYFKNDEMGMKCLNWWKNCLLDKNNEWAEKYGTCGDQKYLEAFHLIIGDNIFLYDDHIGHGAPWNFKLYEFLNDDYIIWKGEKQKLVYNHFSQFSYDENGYSDIFKGHKIEGAKKYYKDYYNHLMDIKR